MKKPETKEEFLQFCKQSGVSKRNAQVTASILYDTKDISYTTPVSSNDLAPKFGVTPSRISAIVRATKKKLGFDNG